MAGHVLITGASGVLGRTLVPLLFSRGFSPIAQFHGNQPKDLPGRWIQADLSSQRGVRRFLMRHGSLLRECDFMVHAYGPISNRPLNHLQGKDFLADYQGNVVACHQIIQSLRSNGKLKSAVTIGFSDTGRIRPFRRVLTHACAKNALLLLTFSLAGEYPDLRVNMVSFPSLPGARIPAPGGETPVETDAVAGVIADLLVDGRSGIHLHVNTEHTQGEIIHEV